MAHSPQGLISSAHVKEKGPRAQGRHLLRGWGVLPGRQRALATDLLSLSEPRFPHLYGQRVRLANL